MRICQPSIARSARQLPLEFSMEFWDALCRASIQGLQTESPKSSQVKSMQDFVHQQYVCMYACAEVEEEVEAVAWMEGWTEGGR